MKKLHYLMRQGLTALAILLLVGATQAPVVAAETAPSADSQETSNGVRVPTGSSAWTYHYNESTGLWENDYYTYNPSTKETVPKSPLEYTYNAETGLWDTYVWEYSAAQQRYEQVLVSVSQPPAGAITHGEPVELPAASHEESTELEEGQTSAASTTATEDNKFSGEGTSDESAGTVSNTTDAVLTNNLDSTAKTGDATSYANTKVGSTGTGDATAVTNIINLLQSQSSLSGNQVATFTADIHGSVQGDFLIDPTALQPASTSTQDMSKLTLNNQTNGSIVNNINLDAGSGDASAVKNTTAGNVTTGDANAIANVINMINSVVAANQSFVGVINIHGDYAGNILMPEESLNALLASSGSVNTGSYQTTNIDNNTTQAIANNINLAATSGTATASQNTLAGNVTTGNGLTNLTILNLTGKQVIAANSMLVFVNVLGTWVGLIMDAPAGATSAALGGGVTTNASLASQTDVNNTENFGITNNITANATTGNAYAGQNTKVGDIATGDATASANVANIIGSQFSLSNWFGVLFINVFGNWQGNFGVYKPPVVPPITSGSAIPGRGAGGASAIADMKVFSFVQKTGSTNSSTSGEYGLVPMVQAAGFSTSGPSSTNDTVRSVGEVLGATQDTKPKPNALQQTAASDINWSLVFLALGFAGLAFVGIERIRGNLRARNVS